MDDYLQCGFSISQVEGSVLEPDDCILWRYFHTFCGLSDFPASNVLQRIFQYFGELEVRPEQTSLEVNAFLCMAPFKILYLKLCNL